MIKALREARYRVLVVETTRTRFIRDELVKAQSTKDDLDAHVLAEYARVKGHLLKENRSDESPETARLKALHRYRKRVVYDRCRRVYQLNDLFVRLSPGYYRAFEHMGPAAVRFILKALDRGLSPGKRR